MKLHTEINPIEQSEGLQEQVFTIKATGKAFSILSSGLYSDKILAIVRELSCNAWDSHVAAGKSDIPIEIKLPSSLDPTFYVKDFGIGLSHEQVLKLYTTYFDSTKQDSNDFIGALGLGSKSPFSYVTTFTVESRYNGVKNIYSCFINEQQLPSIVGLGAFDMEEGEANGMTIALSAKKDDHYKFYQAARKALMYFDPMPDVLGSPNFEPFSLKHTVKGSNWKIRQNDYYAHMHGPHVVQGFVAYPIDGSTMKEHGLSKTAAALADVGIDFSVAIGDVEVAASREALSYDKRTIENLVRVFEQAALEICESFQKSFDNCTTAWEVGLLIDELENSESYEFRNIYNNLRQEKPFTWKDRPVSKTLHLDMSGIKTTQIGVYTLTSSGQRLSATNCWSPPVHSYSIVSYELDINKITYVLVDKEAKGNNDIYRRYLNSLPKTSRYNKLVVIRPTGKKEYNQTEVDRLLTAIGITEHKYVIDTGFTVDKKSYQYTKKNKSDRLRWTGFTEKPDKYGHSHTHHVYSRNTWNNETIDLDEGGFYVLIDRFTPKYAGFIISNLDQILEQSKILGLIDDDTKVYGFKEQDIDKLGDEDEWIDLLEYVKLKFISLNSSGQLTARSSLEAVFNDMCDDFVMFTIKNWSHVEPLMVEGDLKTFMTKLYDMNKTAHSYPTHIVQGLARQLDVEIHSDSDANALKQEWKTICDKYELLSVMRYCGSQETADKYIRYTNLVEKSVDI